MKRLIYVLIGFVSLACTQEETWVLTGSKTMDCMNPIIITEKHIYTKLCEFNSQQELIKKDISFTIIEKIKNDKNSTLILYLLKNEMDGTYTVLPEKSVNDSIRKFDTQLLTVYKYKEAELRAYLFDSLFTDFKGNKNKGLYFISASAYTGREYKRK